MGGFRRHDPDLLDSYGSDRQVRVGVEGLVPLGGQPFSSYPKPFIVSSFCVHKKPIKCYPWPFIVKCYPQLFIVSRCS